MISLCDIIAGVLIGAANPNWLAAFLSSVGWAFVAWLYVATIAGKAQYRPGTPNISDHQPQLALLSGGQLHSQRR